MREEHKALGQAALALLVLPVLLAAPMAFKEMLTKARVAYLRRRRDRLAARLEDAILREHRKIAEALAQERGTMKPLGSTLLEAHGLVTGARNQERGHPAAVYGPAATMTEAWLRARGWGGPHPLTAKDMMIIMTFFKIARESQAHHPDNLVDGAGYLGIAGDLEGSA